MPKLKLSRTNIEKLKPDPSQDTLFWDTETRGFGLRVTKAGVFSFIAQGRVRGTTKDRRVTLGSYGSQGGLTPEEARRRAEDYRRLFEDGVDPNELRRQHEAEQVTLGTVATAYLGRDALKPSTRTWYEYYLKKVFSDWWDTPIASISREMVRDRHAKLVEGGLKGLHPDADTGKDKRKQKGAPSTANSAMIVLRILIRFAADEYRRADGSPVVTSNPVDAMKRHWAAEGSRVDRYIEKGKIGAVWCALHEARAKAISEDVRSGLDLTLFLWMTGARKNEGAALEWDRVNLDETDPSNSWFHLPDPKSGREVYLPLSTQCVELLKSRPRVDGNPFVFTSTKSKRGHILDPRAPMELVSEVAGKKLSCHDLRRSYTNTALRELLIEKFRVDLLTCHVPSHADTTARHYLDLKKLDWLYGETQRVSDWIAEQGRIFAAKRDGENVVELPQRA